jgi:RNA polymerase sigma factor (sigma-70 family)
VTGLHALKRGDRPQVYQLSSVFLYGDIRFGGFYVSEPDGARPLHFKSLLRFLRRKGRSREDAEDAEDLVQEAMLRLHQYSMHSVVVNEEAFLRHAVRNLAIDRFRHDRSVLGREVQIEEVDRQCPLIAPSPTPDQIVGSQQCLLELTVILDAASRRTREIYLAHRSGYSYAEIASEMGIARITVRRHIARAHLIVIKRMNEPRDENCIGSG